MSKAPFLFGLLFLLCLWIPSFHTVEWIGLWRTKPLYVNITGKHTKDNVPEENSPSSPTYIGTNEPVAQRKSKLVFSIGCAAARRAGYFKGKQTKLCHKYIDVMPYVVLAATSTIRVCEDSFSDRRWNCSTLKATPKLSADLNSGTREQSFVYSLASASVAHGTARACSSGTLLSCGCGRTPHEPPTGAFKWGGCADNLKWSTMFTRSFVDSPWKRKRNRKDLLSIVNRHNNKAGRKILKDSVTTQCKCHGVSGSCNIKTCWRALPRLVEIGDRLKRKYHSSIEVILDLPSSRKLVPVNVQLKTELPQDQLIFITKSPDYCLPDQSFGSLGTFKRYCNATSQGTDGCDSMCCGRGYKSFTVHKLERCHCKYYWCCYVKCKTCKKWVEEHQCN